MGGGRDGLELNDDPAFQKKFWILERVAWIVFVLIMAAALGGLAGNGGYWSRATASATAATVDYPRFTRWNVRDEIRLHIAEGAAAAAVVDVDVDFADLFMIETMQPKPVVSQVTGGGHRMHFALGPDAGERTIILHVRATRPTLTSRLGIRVNGDAAFQIAPIVLP